MACYEKKNYRLCIKPGLELMCAIPFEMKKELKICVNGKDFGFEAIHRLAKSLGEDPFLTCGVKILYGKARKREGL